MTLPAGVHFESYAQDRALIRTRPQWIWFAALLCIIIVQVIQEVGMYIVRKTDKRTSA